MNAQRQQRVEALFREVLDCPREQRREFMRRACGEDSDLHQELASLIGHHEKAGTLDRQPESISSSYSAIARAWEADQDELPAGTIVRSYAILDRIGRGGMGVVYRARQKQPDRVVALKVIRPELASGELLRRFEHESRILGRLQHPGIAQIFEAGVCDVALSAGDTQGLFARRMRVPFFAMEFVRGASLTDYAARCQLEVRPRLELLARVCDAVHHAHQQGVIHRDLKPGNILVDEAGQPKVLDFGVARVVDAEMHTTLHTIAGAVIGTLPYMSPEQAAGDPAEVDIRSDVYALGVLAYELLASRPPYDVADKSLPEALLIVRDQEPAPLRTVRKSFRGDIDTIVHRALEKDKTRRYASAAELGADIRRFLHDEPILARPPSALYQLKKLARRHRGAFVASIGAAAFLVLGLIGTSWQAIRATGQRDRAVHAEGIAAQRLSEREIEAAKFKAINAFLIDMLKNADPATSPGKEITVREVVDGAAKRIGAKLTGQAQVEVAVRQTLAEVYLSLSRFPDALTQARRAVEVADSTYDLNLPVALDARNVLAVALRKNGDLEGSERILTETLARCRDALGSEHELTLNSMHSLAMTLEARGKYEASEDLLRRVIEIKERRLGRGHTDTLSSISGLGLLVQARGRPEEAEGLFREAIERRLTLAPADDPQTLTAQCNLAGALRGQKKLDEAAELLVNTLEAQRRVLGDGHTNTLCTATMLASVRVDQERFADAETLFREALASMARSLGERHPDRLAVLNNLAVLLRRTGRAAEADMVYVELVDALRSIFGPDHPNTLTLMSNRAAVLVDLGQNDQARELYAGALAGFEKRFGKEHPSTRAVAGKLEALRCESGWRRQ